MPYYIDFTKMSTNQYRDKIKSSYMVPSRMVLKENTDEIFSVLVKHNLNNVDEIKQALKTKNKIEEFAEISGLDINYLTILNREINSYLQKPVLIKDFPGVSSEAVSKLENIGIKNGMQLFDRVLSQKSRKELSNETGIGEEYILKLTKLADLTRIKWVNHTFANVLYEAGYDNAKVVSKADYNEVYNTVKQLNKEKQLYKGQIGLNDMKLLVEVAADVSSDIEF